jgi:hypothetical protein
MSFYNYLDKDDQVIVPHVEYNARGCGMQSDGVSVDGVMHPKEQGVLNPILNCNNAIFLRVYNNLNEYATYKIP